MSIDRVNLVGNIRYVLMLKISTKPILKFTSKEAIFVPEGYRFVSEIFLMPQMTGTKHEDGTTLRVQLSSSGTHHAHARGESSLC